MRVRGFWQGMEELESRQLLTASVPTNDEQYLIELINRARANPAAEAARYGIDLNEGLPAGTITTAPKPPLAVNGFLVNAARGHSADMIAHNYFAHQGSDGTQPQDRMANSGYFFDPNKSRGSGENLAERGTSGAINLTQMTAQMEQDLFVDSGVSGRGHRTNILSTAYKEVGTGLATGPFTSNGQTFNTAMATQDFAYVLPSAFLTGVAYVDNVVKDNFYTPGEALGGVTVTAFRASDNTVIGTTTTFASGGYSLALNPGTYSVTASGGGITTPITFSNVVIGADNVKRDFVPGSAAVHNPPTAAAHAAKVTKSAHSYKFTVTYTDTGKVMASSLGNGNIQVTGPHGFTQLATLVSKLPSSDSATITATYKITPPGGKWTASANGSYVISVMANQVEDTNGIFAAAGKIGGFKVKVVKRR